MGDGTCLLEKLYEHFHLKNFYAIIEHNRQLLNSVKKNLVDDEFLDEILAVTESGVANVYFGKTLRHLKMEITNQDDGKCRKHEIFFQYKDPRKLVITDVNIPHSTFQNSEYECLNDIIESFIKHINDLSRYFDELEIIDQVCTVMEPTNASFKDNYRRILLDDRIWLHVEVTPEGLATNIHLVGQSAYWNNKLQSGLLSWDHDKNIVDNIMHIFDLSSLPHTTSTPKPEKDLENKSEDEIVCGICLCTELPDSPGVPQPLCQNPTCGVYYHRSCLYQWLVVCAGSRPPAFGVANGTCPTCLQPITCSEKEN